MRTGGRRVFPLFAPSSRSSIRVKSAQDERQGLYDQNRYRHRGAGPKEDGPKVGHRLAPFPSNSGPYSLPSANSRYPSVRAGSEMTAAIR